MEKISLRIPRWLATLAVAAIFAGCANNTPSSTPVIESEPEPEPELVVMTPPLVVKGNAPQQYVVKKGDTLWDISTRFLDTPWRWPELWDSNPQIVNPHLIYPGDLLILAYKDGRPFIQIHRGRQELRLSPKVREEELDRAITTIPMDVIRPFLSRPRVVTQEELNAAPHIVSSMDRHLMAGPGHRVYAHGIHDDDIVQYMVVRPGSVYRNPADHSDILGYEAIHLGDAQLKEFADVSTLQISKSNREILNGDRLLPMNDEMPRATFMPRAPKEKVKGQIIAVPGGVVLIGQHQVVAINLGEQDGMEPGHVLAIYQLGETVRDPLRGNKQVKMPDERAGTLMVFRTFARVSYGLVMRATRTMHVDDIVSNPR
ncbi:MAG: LysM peptidoglycan-binding domain-containing protein [Thiohalomonadaceae bacterium]